MIGRAYRITQILSIDIVIGTVILLRFFCAQLDVAVGWEIYVLLGTTVWLIYTIDHLRDADKSRESTRERYIFHRKHRKGLILISIVVAVLVAPLVFFVPRVIFFGGSALAIFSLIYLLVQHRLATFLSKELYVAVVYSLGILMVPILLTRSEEWTSFILLFLLTLINLVIFSWYEKEEDSRDGFKSIATEIQDKNLEKLMFILLSIGIGISVLSFSVLHIYFTLGFATYALMIFFSKKFKQNHRYRAVGDGIFLLPILFEWV